MHPSVTTAVVVWYVWKRLVCDYNIPGCCKSIFTWAQHQNTRDDDYDDEKEREKSVCGR